MATIFSKNRSLPFTHTVPRYKLQVDGHKEKCKRDGQRRPTRKRHKRARDDTRTHAHKRDEQADAHNRQARGTAPPGGRPGKADGNEKRTHAENSTKRQAHAAQERARHLKEVGQRRQRAARSTPSDTQGGGNPSHHTKTSHGRTATPAEPTTQGKGHTQARQHHLEADYPHTETATQAKGDAHAQASTRRPQPDAIDHCPAVIASELRMAARTDKHDNINRLSCHL